MQIHNELYFNIFVIALTIQNICVAGKLLLLGYFYNIFRFFALNWKIQITK